MWAGDGDRIGRYRIERAIGSGGMGTVYLGWDELLERRVAIKVLHRHRALDGEARARFLREARSLSRLDHPGICTIHDILEHGETQFLILEFVDGVSLREALRERGLDPESRWDVAEALLEAVAAAHREGVVHRDLKPENVMLRRGGGVAVLDFGLARPSGGPPARPAPGRPAPVLRRGDAQTTMTADDVVVGTPGYISPEQIMGRPAGPAADVYALGLVFQELFTGEPAFDRSKPVLELLRDAQEGHRRPVAVEDRGLRALIEEMLAMDPADRPEAAVALRRLRELRAAPLRRRRRRAMALGAAALVAASLLAGEAVRRWVLPAPMLTPGEHARVAVLPLSGPSGPGSRNLGTGVAAMLSRTLGTHPRLEAVPMDQILRRVRGGTVSPEAVGRAVDARVVVQGRWRSAEDGLVLHLRVLDVAGGVQEFSVRARTLPELLSLAASELVRRIAPGVAVVDPRQTFSADHLASLAFAAGEGVRLARGAKAALPYFEVCLAQDPGFLRARLAMARVEESLGRWEGGLKLLEQVLDAARGPGTRELRLQALQLRGTLQLRLGRLDDAEATWRRALALARGASKTDFVIALESNLGVLEQKRGNPRAAVTRYREVARLALERGNRLQAADAMLNLGTLARSAFDLDGAQRYFRRAGVIYRTLGRLEDVGLVEYNLGAVAWMRGDLDGAAERFRAARAAQVRAGNRRQAAEALEGLAALAWSRGRLRESADQMRRALAEYAAMGHSEGLARASGNLATVLRDLGRWDEAAEAGRRCLRLAGKLGLGRQEAACREVLAQVLALSGDWSGAAGVLGDAGMRAASPGALAARALILYQRNRLGRAVRLMRRAAREAAAPDRPVYGRWLDLLERAARRGRRLPLGGSPRAP